MEVKTYSDAAGFLERTQVILEADEVVYSLPLGIALTLKQHPERIKQPPLFRTVEDADGLAVSVLMTPPQNLVVAGHRDDLTAAATVLAEALHAEGVALPGVFGLQPLPALFAAQWTALTGQSYALKSAQRVWELREVLLPPATYGRLRPTSAEESALMADWWNGFYFDVWGVSGPADAREIVERHVRNGTLHVWDVDGRPVSMAIQTRPIRRSISVSMVYTPSALRGRGYATACVGELSRSLLAAGWELCSLFTDLANPVSNHVYAKIGYRPVCDYDEYGFETLS